MNRTNKKISIYFVMFILFLICRPIFLNIQKIESTKPVKIIKSVFDNDKNKIPCLKLSNTICDWGKIEIPDNKELVTSLFIENTGNDTLMIYKIKTDCGCTTYNFKCNSLASGQKEELNVHIAVKKGVFSKKMTIISNDPNNPKAIIQFKGEIIENITINNCFFKGADYILPRALFYNKLN